MLSVVLVSLLAAIPYVKPLPGGLAARAVSVEHLPLPGAVAVQHDALLGALELRTNDLGGLRRHLLARPSTLCPTLEPLLDGLRLRCTSRQFQVESRRERGQTVVFLVELRGLPMGVAADGAPQVFYDPAKFGRGACPGKTRAEKGECALMAGRRTEAAVHFKEAFATDPSFAALRLGDLAFASGDPSLAVAWYQRARRQGTFGRLAIARECELTGSCFHRLAAAFDATGMPEPARTELEMRGIRARMLLGRTDDAVRALTRRLQETDRVPACSDASALCHRVTLAALRDPGPTGPGPAIALYLALPARDRGPFAAELAREVAEDTAKLGAPLFGAQVLSSTAREAGPTLDAHLRRTAELFLEGGDVTRAAVILDYARTRLTPRQLSGAGWRAVQRSLASATTDSHEGSLLSAETVSELAQAEQALAAARRMRAQEER